MMSVKSLCLRSERGGGCGLDGVKRLGRQIPLFLEVKRWEHGCLELSCLLKVNSKGFRDVTMLHGCESSLVVFSPHANARDQGCVPES